MRDVPDLKHLREARALTQRDLAAMSGVAQNTISQLERGERKAMPTTVRKLAEALAVDPHTLLAETTLDRYLVAGQRALSLLPPKQRAHVERQMEIIARSRAGASLELELPPSSIIRVDQPTIDGSAQESEQWLEEQEQWLGTGRWAEDYVSGRAAKLAIESIEAAEGKPLSEDNKRGVYSSMDEMFLQDVVILAGLSQYEEYVTVVRSRLLSDDPKEIVDAAQLALFKARTIAYRYHSKLRSLQRMPDHYYKDAAALLRIQKLQDALSGQRSAVFEAVQEFLAVYSEALNALEDQISKMRKEGEVLEAFTQKTMSGEDRRES